MITRRRLLGGLAGVAAGLDVGRSTFANEPPPETKQLRLSLSLSLCQAPQLVADRLLESEGFTDVQYVKEPGGVVAQALAAGEVQMTMTFAAPLLLRIDAGDPIVLLGGGHIGCLELVVNDRIRAVRDLKGKTVLVYAVDNPTHVFLAIAMAHVGLDYRKDITLVTGTPADAVRMFETRRIDAMVSAPPFAQELRARRLGRVLIDTTRDRPWSQYFCCMVVGNREFVRKHPVATKRAIRAILKSADVCSLEPERTARTLVDKGFTKSYESALQSLKDLPYSKWREYDPEDTIRFYALRLHEAGLIKSSPQKILAQGTDWRFITELRKELKG